LEPSAGFGPATCPDFKKFVYEKYRKTTAKRVMCYANRYHNVLESGNTGEPAQLYKLVHFGSQKYSKAPSHA